MICKECNEIEVIKIYKKENVKFKCKNGHEWYEDYIDQGGIHQRPKSYKVKIEDVLFPSEKALYKKVLREISKNPSFYTSSNPTEIVEHLINNCKFDKEKIYKLFKKITLYNEKKISIE